MPDVPKLTPTVIVVIEDGVIYGAAAYRPGAPLLVVDAADPDSVRRGAYSERRKKRATVPPR